MPDSYMEAHTQGIGELIQHRRFFSVPDHQRDFAWTEEVEEFLKDVIDALKADEKDYFVGLVVLVNPEQDRSSEILDGQQRLATTTMIYAAIREWLYGAGFEKDAIKLQHDFIGSRELGHEDETPRLTLNVNNRTAFRGFVVDRCNDEFLATKKEAAPRYSPERRIVEATIACRTLIATYASECGEEPKNQAQGLFNLANYLRDRVMVVAMDVPSTANAYVIFETLNDRGVDLSVMDLVKSHLFARSGDRMEEVQSNWVELLSNISGKQSDEFLKVFWTSRWGRIQRGKLFHEWRKKFDGYTAENNVTLSHDLAEGADRFSALEVPDHEVWSLYSQKCKMLVKTLAMLGNRQGWPVMLAALEKFDFQEMERLLRHLEVITVRYQLVGQGRTGALEIASARAAHGITNGDLKSPNQVWQEYSSIVPNDGDFRESFFRWSDIKPVRARYVLAELEKAEYRQSHDGAQPDEIPPWEELTLEHILPVNPGVEWSAELKADKNLIREYIKRLGNLCLLPTGSNKKASANSFASKSKGIYAGSGLTLTSEISMDYGDWNAKSIELRQRRLADLAILAWPLPKM